MELEQITIRRMARPRPSYEDIELEKFEGRPVPLRNPGIGATYKHLWTLGHPRNTGPVNTFHCPFCKCWTANPKEYAEEPCEERTAMANRIKEQRRRNSERNQL